MAQQSAADKQAAKNGTGRKRYVRTDAGSRRYKVPIGAEIGSARNAKAAEAQKDTAARGRYEDLVGGDAKAQADALRGLNDADLDKLADVAFSFKSSDPNVVRLRISARNEQARRGRKIKPGQTESNPSKPAAPRGRVGSARTNLAGSSIGPATQILLASNEGTRTTSLSIKEDVAGGRPNSPRMNQRKELAKEGKATPSGSFPIRNVADLRKAIQAFGRAKPQTRGAVARLIVRRARELNASHLVGSGIARAAGKPAAELAAEHAETVELAGKWKHGFIPLDAVAVREKMKGRTGGKQWWSDGGAAPKAKPGSAPKSGGSRTNVVKSSGSPSPARGAKMDRNRLVSAAKSAGLSQKDAEAWADKPESERGHIIDGKEGANQAGRDKNYKSYMDELHKKQAPQRAEAAARRAKLSRSAGASKLPNSQRTPTGSSTDPWTLAENYLKMHGEAKTREKLAKLEASGDESSRTTDLIDGLKSALKRGGGPGKA